MRLSGRKKERKVLRGWVRNRPILLREWDENGQRKHRVPRYQ